MERNASRFLVFSRIIPEQRPGVVGCELELNIDRSIEEDLAIWWQEMRKLIYFKQLISAKRMIICEKRKRRHEKLSLGFG